MNTTQDFLSLYTSQNLNDSLSLTHHGILGQKWGVRRYQNPDGSLTEEGRKRYLTNSGTLNEKGTKRFIDRGDGTYYDATKYARKFGLVGGIVDTARLAKEKKQQAQKEEKARLAEEEKNKREMQERSDNFANTMVDKGWTVTNSYGFDWIESDGKMGDKDVSFIANYNPRSDVSPKDAADQMSRTKAKFEKEYKKVLSTAKEAIAQEMYDTGIFDEWNPEESKYHGMSRNEFKNALPISSVSILSPYGSSTGSAAVELWFNDGKDMKYLMGDHSFTIEYDIDTDKVLSTVQLQG